jgi:hypothetical protein
MSFKADTEHARKVALCALSHAIADNKANELMHTYNVCVFLSRVAHESGLLDDESSEEVAAIAPGLPVKGWPGGQRAARELDLQPRQLQTVFKKLKKKQRYPTLDEHQIEAFVPRVLWPVVERLIEEGPSMLRARATDALETYAFETVEGHRRRDTGGRAKNSVQHMLYMGLRVFRPLSEFAKFDVSLAAWKYLPTIEAPDMPDGGWDVDAPPLHVVRHAWQELHDDVRHRLRAASYEEELERIASISVSALATRGAFLALRNRALLALFPVIGGRVTAMSQITVGDFRPTFTGPYPDLLEGAALQLRPGKHLGEWACRPKLLHPDMAAMLESYLAMRRRLWAAAAAGLIADVTVSCPSCRRLPRS